MPIFFSIANGGTGSKLVSDADLVAQAKKDPNAFAEIFDRYFNRVYQFHYFRIRHQQDAEDLTSETLTKVFKHLNKYQEKGVPFSAWVFKIARNTLVDFVRSKKVDIESIDELEPSQEPQQDFDLTKINNKLLSDKLWAAIQKLPDKIQQVWSLKLSYDPPHKEIAEILGLSENNVNVMVSRSLKQLKVYLSHLA